MGENQDHRFTKGHKKFGGRQKGTANVMTRLGKEAVIEAGERLGEDGKGKGSVATQERTPMSAQRAPAKDKKLRGRRQAAKSKRAESDWDRQHRFKTGHKKYGGRRQGTPNLATRVLSDVTLFAAECMGKDGKGYGQLLHYLVMIALNDRRAFAKLLGMLLPRSPRHAQGSSGRKHADPGSPGSVARAEHTGSRRSALGEPQ